MFTTKKPSKVIEIRPLIFFFRVGLYNFLYNNACSIRCARQVEMNSEKLVKSQGRQLSCITETWDEKAMPDFGDW